MDNISRKRKIKDTDGKSEVKKVRLTRSPSFGKRVTLYSDAKESTSRENDNIVYKEPTNIAETNTEAIPNIEDNNAFTDKAQRKMIKSYYEEKSVAEDIQNHKFYDHLPDELK